MFQKTYQINSVEEISGIAAEIRNMSLYRSASCRVLLAWSQLWDSDGFAAFRQEIVDRFSDFTVIGANSHSREEIQNNILDGSGDEKGCLLTFLFFENSAVSHEIRTPLNSILGMNEMILKECKDENILKYAGNIRSSGKLLLQLINDILDTGKIEAGKMEIVPVVYRPREMMDELAEMISYSAKEKGLEFLYALNGELPPVLYGDEKRIRQCILNLLSNAVKYTPSGKVIFVVSSSITGKEHARLKIRVSDSGIGIKPEDIEKLSHPFERMDHSKNYNVEGTGLGLNIVNRLLALMDSKLEIRSVYGQGSQFSFVIDQEISQDTEEDGNPESLRASSEKEWGDLKAGNASILVVDDTEMNLELVRVLLKNSQIDIDTAQNGADALELAAKQKYDIIFLDLRMPGMDGIEVFRILKEDRDGSNADTPVVLLTANEGDDARRKCIEEGFSDYLPKPFTPAMLEEMIRKHLKNTLAK